MIVFDNNNQIFYLHTKESTYSFGLLEDKALVHLFWGKRLFCDFNEDPLLDYRYRKPHNYDLPDNSTESYPLEYSTFGNADNRLPSLDIVHSDGDRITKLTYIDYEILNGKPALDGLPSTYCENDDNVETLVVHLRDNKEKLDVYLSYSVFEDFDAITRSVKIVNNGQKLRINSALSCTLDFYGMSDSDIIHLDGTWLRERNITRRKIVQGNQNIDSRVGASSAFHNPFIAICDEDTTEHYGDVYGFSLVYSGNFTAGIEMNPYNCGRVYIGINPFKFEYILENKEIFQSPEAVLVYSANGLNGMSQIYHKLYRSRLCRGKYRDIQRFVLINNWEATYFDFNEEKLLNIAKTASKIGADTLVVDDGWFSTRENDNSGLGDWYENKKRLPSGLKGLAEKLNDMGMHLGVWFEPEMVNPDSDLFRKHPDWILHVNGRDSSLRRNQYILDLSREDVCDYIISSISKVLSSANIEYVKWDMNRYMSEVGSDILQKERQGEVYHRYMLGLYYVLEVITTKFPNILFESCASGGGRFYPGMLYYMPQVWTSDNTDAISRLKIQYGTSMVYPYSSMGAHVSVCPNHQVGGITSFEMRCNVALPGQFGFELDLSKCDDEELEIAKRAISRYKKLQKVFHGGNCFRLISPFEKNLSVIEFVSDDKQMAVLCVDSVNPTPNGPEQYIKLRGLDRNLIYNINGKKFSGEYLMNKGFLFVNDKVNKSDIFELYVSD